MRRPWIPATTLLAACAAPQPAPPPAPELDLQVTRFAGDALAGISLFASPPAPTDDAPLPFVVHVLALPAMPEGAALAAHAAAIVRPERPDPLGGHPRAPALLQTRLPEVPVPEALAALAAGARSALRRSLDVDAGTTTTLTVVDRSTPDHPPPDLLLHRDDRAGWQCALATGAEQVLLDVAAGPAQPFAIAMPVDWPGCAAVLLVLQPGTDPDASPIAVERDVDASGTRSLARERAAVPDTRALALIAQAQAFTHLVGARQRRPALLGLAANVGALRCGDLALIADDQILVALAQQVEAAGVDPARSDQELAWILDRAAYSVLLQALQRDTLAPEYLAFLLRHAGAAGRNASELEDALRASQDSASLGARLLDANLHALHDNDPAMRVRATDWLLLQGITVPDYDPLGERDRRRSALAAFEQARASAEARR